MQRPDQGRLSPPPAHADVFDRDGLGADERHAKRRRVSNDGADVKAARKPDRRDRVKYRDRSRSPNRRHRRDEPDSEADRERNLERRSQRRDTELYNANPEARSERKKKSKRHRTQIQEDNEQPRLSQRASKHDMESPHRGPSRHDADRAEFDEVTERAKDSSKRHRHRDRSREKREKKRKHHRSRSRSRSPVRPRSESKHHREQPSNSSKRVHPSARLDNEHSRKRDPAPTNKSSWNGAVDRLADDSDPLEAIVGPLPAPPPKVHTRGRGTFSTNNASMDERFNSQYDPSIDVQPDSAEEDDWDQALEAMRDRQKWHKAGADRLRAAGFTEEQVSKWEKSGKYGEGDVNDVRWKHRGEGREWDRGKVLKLDSDEDGGLDVQVRADFGRLK